MDVITKVCPKCKIQTPLLSDYWVNGICWGCNDKIQKYKNKQLLLHRKWKYQNGAGVYGIFSNNINIYIGETSQLNKRISNHKSYIKNPNSSGLGLEPFYTELQKYKNIEFKILEKCKNHIERESFYIDKYQPKLNQK